MQQRQQRLWAWIYWSMANRNDCPKTVLDSNGTCRIKQPNSEERVESRMLTDNDSAHFVFALPPSASSASTMIPRGFLSISFSWYLFAFVLASLDNSLNKRSPKKVTLPNAWMMMMMMMVKKQESKQTEKRRGRKATQKCWKAEERRRIKGDVEKQKSNKN